ncbi:armadillo-type protein [Lentinula edodes]|uniref:armadillo-type protein n=1 Tax=Lentinula edodes TaxID=5353 RepID=UPI001E8D8592|nr:armadillo-type protein [Lentinula edodes]KAH7878320.1 armadillo-type protein [Lentinula edodes]
MFFTGVMTTINKLIPSSTDIASAYANASDVGQEMGVALALFLADFFSRHLLIMERDTDREALINAHFYLIKIFQVDEREVFKICLEYWLILLVRSYDEEVLLNLRLVAVGKMVKPEEVLVVENEEGEVVREYLQETDTIVLYKSMRELMVCLNHFGIVDVEIILTQKMAAHIDGSEWSWGNSNTICWAVGNEDTKKRVLVLVIRELLGLIEKKCSKDNKAMIAANIMYIVGQYPRFLKAHWRFLKTVVNKLFEFIHETHEGVQDMTCDTYMKITTTCGRQVCRSTAYHYLFWMLVFTSLVSENQPDTEPLTVYTFSVLPAIFAATTQELGIPNGALTWLVLLPPFYTRETVSYNAGRWRTPLRGFFILCLTALAIFVYHIIFDNQLYADYLDYAASASYIDEILEYCPNPTPTFAEVLYLPFAYIYIPKFTSALGVPNFNILSEGKKER